jgi:hypothetical protein
MYTSTSSTSGTNDTCRREFCGLYFQLLLIIVRYWGLNQGVLHARQTLTFPLEPYPNPFVFIYFWDKILLHFPGLVLNLRFSCPGLWNSWDFRQVPCSQLYNSLLWFLKDRKFLELRVSSKYLSLLVIYHISYLFLSMTKSKQPTKWYIQLSRLICRFITCSNGQKTIEGNLKQFQNQKFKFLCTHYSAQLMQRTSQSGPDYCQLCLNHCVVWWVFLGP